MSAAIRWTIDVSEETDRAVRQFLAESGEPTEALAGFVEDAVRGRLLDATVQCLNARNADLTPAELEAVIDAEVAAVRASRRCN